MQLLVSVRSAAEAEIALAGGADIIDAKEPSRGPLGRVSPPIQSQILERIPEDCPVSIALGDVASAAEVLQHLSEIPRVRHAAMYVKLGFAGVQSPELVHQLLAVAIQNVAERSIGIIAVAYADPPHAQSLRPEIVYEIAETAGTAGVLLDTYEKGSGNLLTWVKPERLNGLLARARAAGLITAVAGGLTDDHLTTVKEAGPDIVGFRGAACEGGREGALSAARVRFLRRQLFDAFSGSVQSHDGHLPEGGETPGGSAVFPETPRPNLLRINN